MCFCRLFILFKLLATTDHALLITRNAFREQHQHFDGVGGMTDRDEERDNLADDRHHEQLHDGIRVLRDVRFIEARYEGIEVGMTYGVTSS